MLPSNKPKIARQRGKLASNLYQPSVYRYTCRGAFFASSLAAADNEQRRGTCRGLRSRIQLLSDLEMNTRQGALKDFTYMTDYELDDSDASDLNQQTKSILVSPALIYKSNKQEEDGELPLPEEEIIKRQEWSCYGSTEVEYLVLKDKTGTEEIVGLAPQNSGLSVRHIRADEGSITSYAVGFLNVVVDSGPVVEDETNKTPEEVPERPSQDTMEASRDAIERMFTWSGKFATHINHNAHWLVGTLQDDFVGRTYQAGEKIFAQLPKTVDRTSKFISVGNVVRNGRHCCGLFVSDIHLTSRRVLDQSTENVLWPIRR